MEIRSPREVTQQAARVRCAAVLVFRNVLLKALSNSIFVNVYSLQERKARIPHGQIRAVDFAGLCL